MGVVEDTISVTTTSAKEPPTHDALLRTLYEQQALIAQLQQSQHNSQTIIEKKSEVINSQQSRINSLEEALRILRQKRFGSSSEKNLLQIELLFDEAELLADGDSDLSGELEEPDEPQTTPPRKRKGNKALSASLPRVQVHHYLTDEEKAGAIDTFFAVVKEELDYIPAKTQVIEHLQEKAVFIDDDGHRRLVSAQRPPHPLGKAIASCSLLAFLIISKYADALPLYRLEGILKRYGGDITRTTMANWLIRLATPLQPVLNLFEATLLKSQYVQGDETIVQVLKEPGTEPTSQKYMWVMRGGPPGQPVVIFNYDKSRGTAVAERLLSGFEGAYFQSDGYAGYDAICQQKKFVHLGCWDHVRRGFAEVVKSLPKAKKNSKPAKAQIAISKIDALYRIEREMDKLELDNDERYEYRQKHSVPKLAALHAWLETNAPKMDKDSKTYRSIQYALNQWPKLTTYCDHGSLKISNALAENAIRPFAVGRKNWLFATTPEGARASALYYSLIETAKANNIDPYQYLQFLIAGIATAETVEDYEALLPWNMK